MCKRCIYIIFLKKKKYVFFFFIVLNGLDFIKQINIIELNLIWTVEKTRRKCNVVFLKPNPGWIYLLTSKHERLYVFLTFVLYFHNFY
jgi:hypothetical protein